MEPCQQDQRNIHTAACHIYPVIQTYCSIPQGKNRESQELEDSFAAGMMELEDSKGHDFQERRDSQRPCERTSTFTTQIRLASA